MCRCWLCTICPNCSYDQLVDDCVSMCKDEIEGKLQGIDPPCSLSKIQQEWDKMDKRNISAGAFITFIIWMNSVNQQENKENIKEWFKSQRRHYPSHCKIQNFFHCRLLNGLK